ncbi:MAG TPA: large conductance mechanosensitive channel protein MscL [Vicinamibacterales bacterium]|nr:large conductance mechanosensitive channel protein MscL [Vicinamibacterales bacterium]
MLREFREFIARGNVIDLAVAVVIGVAFGKIVTTFAEGILMPPIGLLMAGIDFTNLFYVLDASRGVPASVADAKANSVPIVMYGQLITDVINFLIVAFAVFLLVRQVNRMKSKQDTAPTTKDCPLCLSTIPLKASRCAHCTSAL